MHPHQPPHDGPHGPFPPNPVSPSWVDVRRRRFLRWLLPAAFSVYAVVTLLLSLFFDLSLLVPVDGSEVLIPVAIGLLTVLLIMLPARTTVQGVRIDSGGVTLEQHPRWWIRGATVHLPWESLSGYRSYWDKTFRNGGGRSNWSPKLKLRLYPLGAHGRVPTWVSPDLSSTSGSLGVTGYTLSLPRTTRDEVYAALYSIRPDLDQRH